LNALHEHLAASAERTLLPVLLEDAPRMNFFRFCELVELGMPDHPPLGATESPADDPLRFRSRRRLGFPSREIDAVEWDADQPTLPPAVRTTFLGLYGVDARMPSYFVDEVAQSREGAESLSGFLDLFHHRVVTQYYRVWRKYRYPVGFRHGGGDEVSGYLLSLVGLGLGHTRAAQAVGTRKLLSMLGLACQKTRTSEGLAGVLQHAVPDARITVEEFVPVWVELNDAEPMPLGENCVLGRGFFDRSNGVRVVIEPRTRETVLALMPGRTAHGEVMALLQFYLGYEAQAQMEMQVAQALMPAPQLNSAQVSLGYTTLLDVGGSLPRGPLAQVTRVQLGTWNRQQEQ
jgi:type VI secretion system protein ImpH